LPRSARNDGGGEIATARLRLASR